ncbi:hypothetical protein [Natrinema pallidum]|uniref:Uncharacterized protein n=1 Tax=Natrinema pallidum TaxID=69527 RepID=A0A4P9TFM6_9EURY|nr:hypothetical protein [Natrinema pallidum]QCW03626.1 hypothetical protein FGF80_10405 [Natrinema pallidum]
MQAKIVGENEKGVGIDVIDNNNSNHEITFERGSFEIVYHQCERYADKPGDRTPEENEHNNQARRYAKWHVYRERGYDTVPPMENPDRIVGAMLALADCSSETIQEQFGRLQVQLDQHSRDTGVFQLPFSDFEPGDFLVYRQDIYVQPDPTGAEPPLVDQFADTVASPQDTLKQIVGDDGLSFEQLAEFVGTDAEPNVFPDFEIETVSDPHYLLVKDGEERTHWSEQPRDRDPDARIELLPLDFDVFDSFQQLLLSHLANQVRDYYLLMGCKPPVAFQQQGLGTYTGFKRQQILDMYEEYFLASHQPASWQPGSLES